MAQDDVSPIVKVHHEKFMDLLTNTVETLNDEINPAAPEDELLNLKGYVNEEITTVNRLRNAFPSRKALEDYSEGLVLLRDDLLNWEKISQSESEHSLSEFVETEMEELREFMNSRGIFQELCSKMANVVLRKSSSN